MHIFGIGEFRTIGTVVACENGNWSIEDDDSRLVYAPVNQQTIAVQIGDRVEIQPTPQGGPVLRPYNWTIVRKVDSSHT